MTAYKVLITQPTGTHANFNDTQMSISEVVTEFEDVPAALSWLERKKYTDADFNIDNYRLVLQEYR